MTKFRLSNHSLKIEKCRYNNTERNNRVCPFCLTCIEDEVHFLIRCPTYNPLRSTLLEAQKFEHLPEETLFKLLMNNKDIVRHNVQTFLLEKRRHAN